MHPIVFLGCLCVCILKAVPHGFITNGFRRPVKCEADHYCMVSLDAMPHYNSRALVCLFVFFRRQTQGLIAGHPSDSLRMIKVTLVFRVNDPHAICLILRLCLIYTSIRSLVLTGRLRAYVKIKFKLASDSVDLGSGNQMQKTAARTEQTMILDRVNLTTMTTEQIRIQRLRIVNQPSTAAAMYSTGKADAESRKTHRTEQSLQTDTPN
ncbi:hypothetical protein MP228_004685 [Amoeboaphelidium protococcarum]|nr:hypothetical protein MP228_004685 [Amoeboaphelidium protococcarum]